MSFAELGLSDQLLRAVDDSGYTEPTPIQRAAIPAVLMGRDLIGIAQTGTGKTAGFVLPMIDILSEGRSRALMPRSLILEPTRELAAQVAENFDNYGKYNKLSMALLIGGVQMGDQIKALQKGVDVLIATPGRLMDLFQRGKILLTGCELLVIDEADRMLDMGFIPDIEEICSKLPKSRQTLLFSATMPPPIQKLAAKFLNDPKKVEVARPATANINIEQRLVEVRSDKKRDVLRTLLRADEVKNAIVFSNRKTTVRELATSLKRSGFAVGQIHGDMDQSDRIAEFDRFKSGEITILVASDVAARGLDVRGRQPCHQFRRPVAARRLYPPHRPHRPRRRQGHCDHACNAGRLRSRRCDRENARPEDHPGLGSARCADRRGRRDDCSPAGSAGARAHRKARPPRHQAGARCRDPAESRIASPAGAPSPPATRSPSATRSPPETRSQPEAPSQPGAGDPQARATRTRARTLTGGRGYCAGMERAAPRVPVEKRRIGTRMVLERSGTHS